MEIVKLNHRHIAFKNGWTIGLKFTRYTSEAGRSERIVSNLFGGVSWNPSKKQEWFASFRDPPRHSKYKPYWIYLKNEACLTAVLLALEFDS